ncbi:MAG: NADH-quinone oxidoreductase subunit M [Bdellovibrionaceae bacterium]|nr:NADH-quinone oxidoreductase subunit M [Bdellovibrionales bacterium]MCB9253091.1 NADH-quinone oxidoreductase subunit M [Pseudobdellovibrionaceae bacterium]
MSTLLLWMVTLPTLAAVFCLAAPERLSKLIALGSSLAGLLLAVVLYNEFDASNAANMQFLYLAPWISQYQIHFGLGVDGLSFPLVLLSKFMMPIAIAASWNQTHRVRAFMACFLLLDTAMTGTFLATDIFLFYVFWELALIPMVLIVGVWGSSERVYAAIKFFLITFAGSLLMLVAIFWVFMAHQEQYGFYSAEIRSFYSLSWNHNLTYFGLAAPEWIFLAFAIAFCIKIPLFPLHTWLPDAHTQAPTGGSILLAAVMLKMGTYGILRFCVPITPDAFHIFAPYLATLGLVGILYGAWVAFQQADVKKLVAYSSVSHVGFIVLGICAMNPEALTGAMLQMVNHGLSTGALFFLIGALYERRHSRQLSDFGGLAKQIPWFAFFLVFVSASSMGVPGLNGFVGEFLILLGSFKANAIWGCVGVLGVIFAAVYMLWMLRGVLWGPLSSEENKKLTDLNWREALCLSALGVFIIWLGVYPKPFIDKMRASLESYWKQGPTVITMKVDENL